jgi:putative transposase
MKAIVLSFLSFIACSFRSRFSIQLEILALRHQLAAYQRRQKRPVIKPADRFFWAWLSKLWSGWRHTLVIVRPGTVIAWQRKRFREYWSRLSRRGLPGRPKVLEEIRDLIRTISSANPTYVKPSVMWN